MFNHLHNTEKLLENSMHPNKMFINRSTFYLHKYVGNFEQKQKNLL